MSTDVEVLYSAYASRDPRFDGVFFVGVTSTRIYCRPVCTARTPKLANCRFFGSAEMAERASFRPCLRCRPELAPGNAPVDDAQRIASFLAQRIAEGKLDDGLGMEDVARHLGWSARHVRRIITRELGVSPMELLLTRRLLLAKQLLTDTELAISQVAFASGFSSLRRFNDAFRKRYGMPPTRLRTERAEGPMTPTTDPSPDATFTLRLTYRPPYDWAGTIQFLATRTLAGVETISADEYVRTVRLGAHVGWVRVRHAPHNHSLVVKITHSLTPVLPSLLERLRHLFDLDARPDVIEAQLGADPWLAASVAVNPGLRVPGAFDGFELAVRAILGQQITVKGATTLAGRLVATFGAPFEMAGGVPTHLSPTAQRLASARVDDVAELGIVKSRAQSIIALATEVASGRLTLEAGALLEPTIAQLVAIRGIGQWTAHYIAMRALRWPDAFPQEDIVLRKQLGNVTGAEAGRMSHAWRPWRSYATLHLWRLAASPRP